MTGSSPQIIYLNGPSSSGKTTLAKGLQHTFDDLFLHVGIDKIIGWMPEKVNDWTGGEAPFGYSWKKSTDASGNLIQELQIGSYAAKIAKTFQEVVLTLVKMGHHLIIDDVSFGKKQVDQWKKLLKDFNVLWIGVNAPLSVLEQREKERGNRITGSARGQFDKVHADVAYDLKIDTHHETLGQNIQKIKSLIADLQDKHSHFGDALEAMRNLSRTGVYGIVKDKEKVLLVVQKSGPYAGLFDLPGGGIEFGETPTQALHREFIEETGMNFESMHPLDNFSVATSFSPPNGEPRYTFHQIGLIYSIEGIYPSGTAGALKYEWTTPESLTKERVSPLTWMVIEKLNSP